MKCESRRWLKLLDLSDWSCLHVTAVTSGLKSLVIVFRWWYGAGHMLCRPPCIGWIGHMLTVAFLQCDRRRGWGSPWKDLRITLGAPKSIRWLIKRLLCINVTR